MCKNQKKETFTFEYSYAVTEGPAKTVTFWVEGITPTESFDSLKFKAVYTVTNPTSGLSATATGTIAFGVTQADLDVDSDNQNGTEETGYDDDEDRIEFSFKEEQPGKILLETRNDVDSDGVIDSVDGISELPGTGGTPIVAGLKLIPMRLILNKPFTTATAKVKFSYRASVPHLGEGIETNGQDTAGNTLYRITTPGIRLWTKDCYEQTSGLDVGGTSGGDFIPADTEIKWEDLFEQNSEESTEKIIYVEYVDVEGSAKQFSKEDIVVEISDDTSSAKGYIQYNGGEKKPLSGTRSPDGVNVALLPVEVAPEVLAVNSDFDEGRIDPHTGYAIPDCDDIPGVDRKTGAGNGELRIDTDREHLDGLYANDERVTDDMHKGWFGVDPKQLGNDFWDGATVTIRKIDKIDEDTGRKESGQVRFYAKWGETKFGDYYGIIPYDLQTLAPNNLVTSGVNARPGEGVYGSTSTIPDNAEFWMEGVRPGKITLEWRLQKGDTDMKYEQTFLVATQKSKQEWLDEVYYQVKLQSTELMDELAGSAVLQVYPVDMNQFDPKNGFFKNLQNHNYAYIQRVYYYYQQLFKQNPEELYWAGMAKTAGASVYAGMGDMHIWWHTAYETFSGAPNPFDPDEEVQVELDKVLDDFLVTGNKNIFRDMAWSHHAYASSGIWALRYIDEISADGEEPITDFSAWENIDAGIQGGDQAKLSKGNRDVLFREQNVVMPPLYNQMKLVWVKPHSLQWLQEMLSGFVSPSTNANGEINMDEAFSLNAQNPIDKDTGPMFRDVVPNGSLSNFNDRWSWIENPQKGMLQIWMGTATETPAFDVAKRSSFNGLQLYAHAIQYSMSKELPLE